MKLLIACARVREPRVISFRRTWSGSVPYTLRVATAAILIVALVVPVADQQYPSPPFYQLLPFDYPYPLIRVCSTQWGICAIPAGIVPGTPCSCLAAYGGWLPGVCVR